MTILNNTAKICYLYIVNRIKREGLKLTMIFDPMSQLHLIVS